MTNKIIKILLLINIIFSLSGCFSYQEINDYAIVSAISIDLDDKDKDKYEVGVQIMNAKKDEESNNSLITFYKAKGKTIYEAFQRILLDSPKELYLSHNEVIVIGEDLLKKKNPLDYLDYFMRDAKMEKDSLVLVSRGDKASNTLKVITPLETIPSKNLMSTIIVSNNFSGITSATTLDEFISTLNGKGEEAVVPSIKIIGKVKDGESMDNIKDSSPDATLKIDTLGIFKDNKLVGYLNHDESAGYTIINNMSKEMYLNVLCDDKNYASVKVSTSDTKEKLSFKNKKPYVELSNNITVNLMEYNCKTSFLKDEKKVKELEKKVASKVKSLMKKTTNAAYKEYQTDILKYGSKFYKTKYKNMKKLGLTRDEIKDDISFKFKAKAKIKSIELSTKSVKEEVEYE